MHKSLPYLSKAICSIAFLITANLTAYSQNEWIKKADFAGAGRMGAVGFSVGNKGYFGLGMGAAYYHDMWEYDPATDTWTQKADYPGSGSNRAISFGIGDKGYVGTGETSDNLSIYYFSDFYQFDPVKNTWTKKSDYPGGAVSHAVGFSIGAVGYVGTGRSQNAVSADFYAYDPNTDKWTKKADFAGGARMSAVGFSIGSLGYLGTGNTLTPSADQIKSDFWCYDPSINQWQRKADFSIGGGPYVGESIKKTVFSTGKVNDQEQANTAPVTDAIGFSTNSKGYVGTGTAGETVAYFSEYDPMANTWTQIADFGSAGTFSGSQNVGLSRSRDNAAGFAIGSTGYVGTGHFGGTFNDFYAYTPCGDKNITAQFDVVADNYKVNFLAKQINNVEYFWNFGDATYDQASDTSRTPLHTYATAGTYKVMLTVYSSCFVDTLSQIITVSGITGIVNNHGANTGVVTANVIGGGFTGISLSRGAHQIVGTNLKLQDDGSYTVNFDLTGQAVGFWDVVAKFPDGRTVTLPSQYTVENLLPGSLNVSLTGDWVVREGFNQLYTLNYSNTGNADANLVPVFIGGLPLGTIIEIKGRAFDVSTIPGNDSLKTILTKVPTTINDTTSQTSFRLILLRRIPANSSGNLTLVFHVPLNIPTEQQRNIICTIGSPLQVNGAGTSLNNHNNIINGNTKKLIEHSSNSSGTLAQCDDEVIQQGVEKTIEKALGSDHDVLGYASCFTGLSEKVYDYFSDDGESDFIDRTSSVYSTVTTASSCTRAAVNTAAAVSLATGNVEIALPAMELSAELMARQEALEKIGPFIDGAVLLDKCAAGPLSKYGLPIIIGNAYDPNQLYGIGDGTAPNYYTNQKNMLHYTANFENKPSANLAAQTVLVIDTLNRASYNLKSFGFTSVTIGDSTFVFKTPVKSFIHDFDFTSLYQVKARVVAVFDTTTGIAKWQFLTIDPLTNQATGKALAGFLPPDKTAPQGQGFVGYQIAPKNGIATNDEIQNKAYITFDNNPVIPTNAWNNTFDFIAPQSNVKALPAVTPDSVINVQWSGTDNLSGVRRYNVFYAVGNGPFQLWLSSTSQTSGNFIGKPDSTYKFYSIAYDKAGNVEVSKFAAEAKTTIKLTNGVLISSFSPKAAETGNVITITGTGFSGATAVSFGGTPASSFTIVSPTTITAVVAAGNSGDISVTTPQATATLSGFSYTFTLPASNFKLGITSATCKGSSDGSVNITAVQNLNYTATVTGNGLNTPYPFTRSTIINNLAAGTYHICMTVAGQPNFSQCYDAVVTEPADLSVYSMINTDNSLTLALSGGSQYNILLNGATYTTSDNSITLPMAEGNNDLTVSTDRLCQGSYKKLINISGKLIPYPDPFGGILNLNLGNNTINNVLVDIHNVADGKLVYSQKYIAQSGVLQLDLTNLDNGVYALHLSMDNFDKVYKIIKK